MINDAWEFIKNAPGELVDAGKEKVDDVVDGVKQGGKKVAEYLGFGEEEKSKISLNSMVQGDMDNPTNIFSQTMRSAEQLDYDKQSLKSGANIINNSGNSVVNNNSTSVLKGEKSSSNNEPTMKNARMIRNIRFINN